MLSISFFALGFTAKGSRFFSREFSCLPLSVGSVGRTTFSVVAQAFCLMPNFRGTQGGVRSQSHRSVSSAYCAFGIGVVQLGYRGNPISCVVRVFRVRPSAGGHADGPSWLPFHCLSGQGAGFWRNWHPPTRAGAMVAKFTPVAAIPCLFPTSS